MSCTPSRLSPIVLSVSSTSNGARRYLYAATCGQAWHVIDGGGRWAYCRHPDGIHADIGMDAADIGMAIDELVVHRMVVRTVRRGCHGVSIGRRQLGRIMRAPRVAYPVCMCDRWAEISGEPCSSADWLTMMFLASREISVDREIAEFLNTTEAK